MIDNIRKAMGDKGKRTLADLIVGILAFSLLALALGIAICIFFKFSAHFFALGVLFGAGVAVFMTLHMYSVLEKAMLCDKKRAKHKTKLGAVFRMLVMVGAMTACILLPGYEAFAGCMVGIFSLKIAALSQPKIDKFVSKFVKKEE